jgi:hypothetical protein
MTRTVTASIALVLVATFVRAGGLEDGIYYWSDGAGPRTKRNDGAEVVLGQRLGNVLGQATIGSTRNDNSQFRLELKNAGPIEQRPGNVYLAVIVDGIIAGVWSQSDRRPDGTMNLACTIHGEEAARKVAERLKVQLNKRTHPGHRFEVRWTPEKDSYQVGEDVKLKLEIKNVGTVPFAFRVGSQQRGPRDNQYRFLAYRGAGGGKAVPDTGNPVNFGGISVNRTLQPKETFMALIGLDKWFTFAEPDTYRITGVYELELYPPDQSQWTPIWDDLAVGDCLVRVVPKGK